MLTRIQPTDIIIHPNWAKRAFVKELADTAVRYGMFLCNRQGRRGKNYLVFSANLPKVYEINRQVYTPR